MSVASYNHGVLCAVEDAAAAIDVEVESCRQSFRPFWLETSVVPAYFDFRKGEFRKVRPCREGEFDHLGARAAVREDVGRAGLDLDRVAEFETLERNVHDMAGHVTESACAEIPPAAEVPRGVDRVVVAHRSRTDEGIPVQG